MAVLAFGHIIVQTGPPSTAPGGAITINDNANASPYPSTVLVTNYVGHLSRVTVSLNGVTHGYPDDIDVVLEAPNGERVILMSDAGGQFDLGSVDITFDSSAPAASQLPNEAPITSGRYRPTNFDGGDADPAEFAGASTDLGVFVGDDANGVWRLFVRDDTVVDAGNIRSWTLNIFTEPVVTVSTNRVVTAEDTAGSLVVTANDSDTPASGLTFTAFIPTTSTNLIQSVAISGSGTNRTYTVNPRSNQTGTGQFEVRVNDGITTTTTTIDVEVTAVNDRPSIALNTGTTQVAQGGISTNVLATVGDVDNDPATLVVTAFSSSNPAVVPASNVFVVGSGTNNAVRHVRFSPAANAASGTATITLHVSDVGGATNTTTIDVTVTPVSHIVAGNPAAITIPTSGTATPYPSTVSVANASGLVGEVTVTLLDFNHAEPDDVGLLLVGPAGQKVVLARGAGGTTAASDLRLVFDNDNGDIPAGPLTSSTNGPADYTGGNFPGSAPAGPYTTELSDFRGTNPNGTWSLYVYDAEANTAGGAINGGFAVNIFLAPVIGPIGGRQTQEDTPIDVTFTVTDQDATVTNIFTQVITTDNTPMQIVNITTNLSGNNATVRVIPIANLSGTNFVRVIAQDNQGFTGTNIFSIVVFPVNDNPTQSVIPKQLAPAGQSVGPISFTVSDIETPPGDLVVTATSNNPKLLPPGAIVLGGSGGTRTITIFPSGAQGGQADITVTVRDPDGGISQQTFDLTVEEAAFPLFEQANAIQINDNNTATPYPSIISVTGLTSPITEVQVTLFGITHPKPDDLDIMLVHPNGSANIVIMSDAGGGADKPLNNVTLIFRDGAVSALGDEVQIVSGTYLPSNYGSGDFPRGSSPGDSGATTFNGAFGGLAANGDWKLYVVDDEVDERGGVITSWQLGIRTRPDIAAIPDQTTAEDTQLRFSVDLGDAQPGVDYNITSTVTGTPDVIDTITFDRSGDQLVVTIVPEDDAFGTNQVTITVEDPEFAIVDQSTFNFIVTPRNDAPRFSNIPNTNTPAATPIEIAFSVVDVEGSSVIVTATSSNPDVASSIAIIPPSGTVENRIVRIVPQGVNAGTTTITLTGSDGTTTSTESFVLTVDRNVSFANTRAITINDFAPASPYPSTIDVSGVLGTVSDVSVVLVGFTHQFPDDVDVLLVSPDNREVMLMSDAGGSAPVTGRRLTFTADSGNPVPDSGTLADAVYAPANYTDLAEGNESQLPSPAPAGPYDADLTDFEGVNPNGQWRLFVRDDTFQLAGEITGGWILILETGPTITTIPSPQTTREDITLDIPFTVSDQDTPASELDVTATVVATGTSDPNLVVATNLVIIGTNETRTLRIIPTANLSGTNLIELRVEDENGTVALTTFAFRVTPVDDAPVFLAFELVDGKETNRYVLNEDGSRTISFNVGDIDSVVGTTNITFSSSNPTLLTNIVIGGEASEETVSPGDNVAVETLTVTPNANQNGTVVVTLSLRDQSSTVTTNITIDVTPVNDVPTINTSTNFVSVVAGQTSGVVNVRITDIETSARNLTLTANSRNPSIIPTGNVILGGSDTNRTAQFVALSTPGTAVIELIANDGTASTTNLVTVEVRPAPGFVFANANAITIRDNNTAQPYPSSIVVSGMRGPISRVSVTIDGLSHTAPDDVDILLVHSSSGRKAILLSDVGGGNAISNARLTFDERAGNRNLADDSPIVSGTYLPTDYQSGDVFPSAPAGPYTASLATFNGLADADGTWNLYVVDDAAANSGSIAFGWSLRIETAPTITLTSGNTTTEFEDVPANVTFTIDDMTTTNGLSLTYTNSNSALIQSVVQTPSPINSPNISLTITPTPNASGQNVLTITVRRPSGDAALVDASSSVTVTNIFVATNDLPTMSRVIDQTSQEDIPVSFELLVGDVDHTLAQLWLQALSSNDAVISDTNILINGSTNFSKGLPDNIVRITLRPNSGAVGTSTITLNLSETGTNVVTSNFVFTVTERNDRPIIVNTNADPVSIASGETRTINLDIRDPEGLSVNVTASSSDQSLVRDADIIVSPASGTDPIRNITITAQAGVQGRTTITVVATDPANNRTTTTFTVDVRPTRERVFSNTGLITINDNGPASPYPSIINVSNLVGSVAKVTVTLNRFHHTFPDDVDIMLVGPSGTSTLIWSDVGGSDPDPTNIIVKLDDAAVASLPNNGPLVTGTFKPTAEEPGTDPFTAPAPASSTNSTLSVFNNDSPNGEWRLYVIDDTASDAGFISGGWSLGITTQPTLLGLNNVTSVEDVPARVSFTVAEESFASTDFTFTVVSSNPAVVPSSTNNIVITGTGTNYTVNVIPVSNAVGSSTITVTLRNADGQQVSDTFVATFTAVNDRPVITQVPNQTVPVGGQITITNFNYADVETEKKDLVIDIISSNPAVISADDVVIIGNDLTIISDGTAVGRSTVTITVTDAQGASANTVFEVAVTGAANPVFANTDGIIIRDNTTGLPYPSTIAVADVGGTVTKVTVTLTEVRHAYPDDVDILLVGPNGQSVVLMSDAGAGGTNTPAELVNGRLTFDDAGAAVPDNSEIAENGMFRPSNYEGSETFPTPAPAGPYGTALSVFNGTDPNGTWSLYVMDDASPDAGSIGSWILSIQTTAPTITQIPDTTLDEDTPITIPFSVSAPGVDPTNLVVSATIEGTPIVSLTINGTGNDRTLTITPRSSQIGTNEVTLTLSDASGENTNTASTTFTVIVRNVDEDAPVIQPVGRQTVRMDETLVLPLVISDPDTELADLTFFSATAGTNIVQSITFGLTTNDTVVATIVPRAGVIGTETITLTVSDGANVSRTSFEFEVRSDNDAPVIQPIADVQTPEDVNVVVRLTITDDESPLDQLTITGSAANTNLVSSVAIAMVGGTPQATINLVPNASGTSLITIRASDGTNTTTATFTLIVVDVPECPVLGAIGNQTVAPGAATITVPLTVSDPDNSLQELTFLGAVSGTNVVQSVTFNTSGSASIVLNIRPGASGTDRVTITVSDGNCLVRQSFDVTVGDGQPGDPATLGVSRTGTNFVLSITGTVGATYIIEASSDLRSWTQAGAVTIPAGGSTQVTIPITGNFRFFRVVSGSASPAQAAVYEGYGYPAGTTISTNENGGTGWTGPWTPDAESPTNHVVLARGLEYGDGTGKQLITTAGSVFYTATNITGDVRSFRNFEPRTNGVTWVSFIGQRMGPTVTNTGTPANPYPRAANLAFFEGGSERFAIGNGSGAVSNFWSVLPSGSVANVTNDQRSATPMNQQAFIVLRIEHIEGANDNLHMWINPRLGSEPSIATANARSIGAFSFSFDRIRPFVGAVDTGNNRPYAELALDEIRVGSSFASVTPFDSDVTASFNAVQLVNGTNDGDTAAGAPPANEGVIRVVDGVGQKYLNFLDLNSGFVVTPLGSSVVDGISFWTANDAPERDPASYVLEGSNAGSAGPWTVISQGDVVLPAGRNPGGAALLVGGNVAVVRFSNTTAYTSYRVTFPTLKNAATANSMQIAEVDLLGSF